MKRLICVVLAFILLPSVWSILSAHRVSVSTNLLDYAHLGTLNIDASYAVSRHWSLVAGARYNPFTYNADDRQKQFQYRQQSYAVGVRWWLWHTWSGWWFSSKARYQEYNAGGLWTRDTEEGDRVGAGLYVGYTHMLSPHMNVEFGCGVWGGISWYTSYSCPTCGYIVEEGEKFFMRPDDFMISVVYVF